MAEKKSFVLYFDMYPNVRSLPLDQKGELFSAVFEYAAEEAEGDDLRNKEMVLARHPCMDGGTRMAFSFIAEAIHRDTVKWRQKQERYQKAAEKRWEKETEQMKYV